MTLSSGAVCLSATPGSLTMAGDRRRPERVAEGIRAVVATALTEGSIKDPRITGLITVTGVDATRDLRHARIFVSIMGDDAHKETTLAGLKSLAGHLKARVGKVLQLRVTPDLTFVLDPTIERAARIETLLAQLRDDSAPKAGHEERSGE